MSSLPPWIEEARAHLAEGRPADAAARCREALAHAPDDADAWNLLGVSLCMQGLPSDGLKALDRAVALRPDDPWIHLHHGNARAQCDQRRDAVESYRAATRLKPDLAPAYALLGSALLKLVDQLQQRLVETYSGKVLPLHAADHLRAELRTHDLMDIEAEAALARASALSPDNVAVIATHAESLRRVARSPEAIERCRHALSLAPDDPKLKAQLEALERQASDPNEGWGDAGASDEANAEDDVPSATDDRARQALFDAIVKLDGAGPHPWRALELGCGTGLFAPRLRSLAHRLEAVDESAEALHTAEASGRYDLLEQGDLLQAVEWEESAWDLIVATEVAFALGDLTRLFTAFASALTPSGRCAFVIESAPGDGFERLASGRCVHAESYVRRVAAERGLAVAACEATVVRQRKGLDVPGRVFVLTRA